MKKRIFFVAIPAIFLFTAFSTLAAEPIVVDIDLNDPPKQKELRIEAVYGEETQVTIRIPESRNLRLVHKIASGLVGTVTGMLTGDCSLIKRLNTPALIVCLGITEESEITYSAFIPEKTSKSGDSSREYAGFTAAKGIKPNGNKFWFFEKEVFEITASPKPPSPSPTKRPPVFTLSPTPIPSPTPVMSIDDPNDIPKHKRTLSEPETQIIVNNTDGTIVASAVFEPQNEAMIIEELTVELTGVNTNALYPDVADDLALIEAVSLYYQDGTPVLQSNGAPAKTGSILSNGKAKFSNLNLAIPESGERLYVAVDTGEMLEGTSGAAFTAEFSFDAGDFDIRGFWSGDQIDPSSIDEQDSPVQYVLANALNAESGEDQNERLLSGRNSLLAFDLNVNGGDEAFVKSVTANITKSTSGGGFDITRLRLRSGSDIIASKTGADLSGEQTLTVGQCAGGDICSSSEADSEAIFREIPLVLEAVVSPAGGGLTGSNSLSASLEINGPQPGDDGILWQDYGSGEDDGVTIQWVQSPNANITRLENTLRTP